MTIRHRITLLVVLTFFALSAIGIYAVYQTRKSASEVRQVIPRESCRARSRRRISSPM